MWPEPIVIDLASMPTITLTTWLNEIQSILDKRIKFMSDPIVQERYRLICFNEGMPTAIKAFRTETSMPLKESKDFIDALMTKPLP